MSFARPRFLQPGLFAAFWKWLFSADGSIRHRAMRGGIWLLVLEVLTRAASILKITVLGRLLTPADFGQLGAAMILLYWMDLFSQTGLSQALIQRQDDVKPYLDTAFTVQAIRGLTLFGVLFAAAPLGSMFFKTDVTLAVRVAGLVLLLRGLNNPAVVYLRRDLDFRRETLWRSIGTMGGLVVAIVVGVVFRNVWALLTSILAAQLFETASSYWVTPYCPRPRFDRGRFRHLFSFGRWVFLSNLFIYFGIYADSLAVGRFLGNINLGLYQVALQLAMTPLVIFGTHVNGVSFAAFSRIKDPKELAGAYLRVLRLVSVVAVPVVCILTAYPTPVVKIALGAKWLSITPLIQILGWGGVGMAIAMVSTAAILAMGRPELHFRVAAFRSITLAILLFPLIARYGNTGAAIASAIAMLVTAVYGTALVVKLLNIQLVRFVGTFKSVFLASGMFIATRLVVPDSLSWFWVAAMILPGVVFGVTLKTVVRTEFREPSSNAELNVV